MVDHRAKEKELKEMILAKYGHDVRKLFTLIQVKKNEIDNLFKDGVKFNN